MTHDELDEHILGLTSGEDWEAFLVLLNAEANAALQNELDAENMEDIKFIRGYRAGLAFVANVREQTKLLRQNDADV